MSYQSQRSLLGDDKSDEEDDSSVKSEGAPHHKYFKGFFAFAIWGYIPPPGGEEFQSLYIKTCCDTKIKGRNLGQASAKKEELEESNHNRWLDKRGTAVANKVNTPPHNNMIELMSKGRIESQRQKAFCVKIEKLEFQMYFHGE